jgi:hypothetical protein
VRARRRGHEPRAFARRTTRRRRARRARAAHTGRRANGTNVGGARTTRGAKATRRGTIDARRFEPLLPTREQSSTRADERRAREG